MYSTWLIIKLHIFIIITLNWLGNTYYNAFTFWQHTALNKLLKELCNCICSREQIKAFPMSVDAFLSFIFTYSCLWTPVKRSEITLRVASTHSAYLCLHVSLALFKSFVCAYLLHHIMLSFTSFTTPLFLRFFSCAVCVCVQGDVSTVGAWGH